MNYIPDYIEKLSNLKQTINSDENLVLKKYLSDEIDKIIHHYRNFQKAIKDEDHNIFDIIIMAFENLNDSISRFDSIFTGEKKSRH